MEIITPESPRTLLEDGESTQVQKASPKPEQNTFAAESQKLWSMLKMNTTEVALAKEKQQ